LETRAQMVLNGTFVRLEISRNDRLVSRHKRSIPFQSRTGVDVIANLNVGRMRQ